MQWFWVREHAPPKNREFLGYDSVADKYDVCFWAVEDFGGEIRSTQADQLYGPLDDDFQPARVTHWAEIVGPFSAQSEAA